MKHWCQWACKLIQLLLEKNQHYLVKLIWAWPMMKQVYSKDYPCNRRHKHECPQMYCNSKKLETIQMSIIETWIFKTVVCLQCRILSFHPWVGKIPWRREWLSTPVFLLRQFPGQRSLVHYSPQGGKEPDTNEQLALSCFMVDVICFHCYIQHYYIIVKINKL